MSIVRTSALADKCLAAGKKLSEEHGGFALFCLVQRESTAGKWDVVWDVVASAPWLTTDRAGIRLLGEGLLLFLSRQEWLQLASPFPVAPNTEFV